MSDNEIWEELEKRMDYHPEMTGIQYKEITRIAGCTIFYSFNNMGRKRGIIIRVPDKSGEYRLPPSRKGFEIKYNRLVSGSSDSELIIQIIKEEYNDIFSTFCLDLIQILENITETRGIIDETLLHLKKWQDFMEKITGTHLTPNQRLGLFGELYFLSETLIPVFGIHTAIRSWYGPDRKQQDFLLDNGMGIEIKTSASKSPVSLQISSERQLDNSGFTGLYLHYIEVVETSDKNKTLNDIVDEIRSVISRDPETARVFSLKLLECNYREKDRNIYSETGYSVSIEQTYQVTEGFPNITERDLRDGVCDVKYSVLLVALTPFRIEELIFRNIISGSNV